MGPATIVSTPEPSSSLTASSALPSSTLHSRRSSLHVSSTLVLPPESTTSSIVDSSDGLVRIGVPVALGLVVVLVAVIIVVVLLRRRGNDDKEEGEALLPAGSEDDTKL